jgi:Fe-S-cluster containining protein
MREQAPDSLPEWWREEGAKFTCARCGSCCRGEPGAIFFTPEEEVRIRERLKIGEDEFRRTYVTLKWGRPSFRERRNGDCVFYDASGAKCAIYSFRPAQCSLFPFWPSLLASKAEWDEEAKRCLGINEGRIYTSEEIQELLKQCPFEDL